MIETIILFNNILHFFIGEPVVGMNRCFSEPILVDLPLMSHLKYCGESELVLMRSEGTEFIRYSLRQHGVNAIGQIHRCCSGICFLVQSRFRLDVMTNIRNMHTYFKCSVI